jgi:protein-S-isoprenylcysteine O-methyltransferase Ste14
MKQWQSWLAVIVLAALAFVLIHLGLRAFGLETLFQEQIPVGTPGRSLVVLAIVAPFGIVLLASLLGSTIARSSTLVAYIGSWIVYASLLSQALLSMSGAFLLILPLILPVAALTGWVNLDPAHKGYLPIHYTAAHEPVVTGLVSIGFALIVVGLVEIVRAKRRRGLATGGLYASMRHPQHLGIVLWTLGFALWGASVTDLVIWFIVSYIFVCLAVHEEGQLVDRFDGQYEDYRQRTLFMPPLIPIRGSLLPHGGTGKELGLFAGMFVAGVAVILLIFYVVGVPR